MRNYWESKRRNKRMLMDHSNQVADFSLMHPFLDFYLLEEMTKRMEDLENRLKY